MRRLWLVFAQAVTISVAALFVIQTLKPEWLDRHPGLGAGGIVSIQETAAPTAEPKRPVSYADAARKATPAVVLVYTSQEVKLRHPFANDPFWRHFFGDRLGPETQQQTGLGSGVIVSGDGYILTNYHVVEAADQIEVASNDGRKFKARLVGSDPESDLAVLKVEPGENKLPTITFAPSESLRVGDFVLAVGNPFGVGQTVTLGIVSALNRTTPDINLFAHMIQTDAAINPGNSGGALVDGNGNLVGINAAIYSQSGGSQGIGYAIPVSLARTVMEQIIRSGSVTRGWIGVELQEITPELAEAFRLPDTRGAMVAGLGRGTPAHKGGIKPGDVLLAVDGQPVRDTQSALELIAALKPGQESKLTVRREGRETDLAIQAGKRPKQRRE